MSLLPSHAQDPGPPTPLDSLVEAKVVSDGQACLLLADHSTNRWASPFLRGVPEHTRYTIDRVLETTGASGDAC